jgi:hypothetical protein
VLVVEGKGLVVDVEHVEAADADLAVICGACIDRAEDIFGDIVSDDRGVGSASAVEEDMVLFCGVVVVYGTGTGGVRFLWLISTDRQVI